MSLFVSSSTPLASGKKSSSEEISRQAQYFTNIDLLSDFLNAVPNVFVVLNANRQIVFANRALYEAFGLDRDEVIYGQYLGDLLSCSHVNIELGQRCGSTEFCHTCGALQATLRSLHGQNAIQEYRIVQHDGAALDLRVSGSTLRLNEQVFSLFAIEDISHHKRRQVLERLFFHDILNIAGVVLGYAELLQNTPTENSRVEKIKTTLYHASVRLVDEIESQRQLSAAESGDLKPMVAPIHSLGLLRSVQEYYQGHETARDRQILIDRHAQDIAFESDMALLRRVIENLVKNALEACEPCQFVTLSCKGDGERVLFTVHNPTPMPRDVELQIFQRSFSTKGYGRGLGTYSVKLLTERYLRGTVEFVTSAQDGTTFVVSYPLFLDEA
ncbi:MAG: PAS domain-containing sensor histidine kinase [Chloroflexi bacterium]|nr:PAS domain-containing sensor histidine kinase [Chloroflexota bacterium]